MLKRDFVQLYQEPDQQARSPQRLGDLGQVSLCFLLGLCFI